MFEVLAVGLIAGATAYAIHYVVDSINEPGPVLVKWLARHESILPPEQNLNVLDFSVSEAFLIGPQGTRINIDLFQYVQLPTTCSATLSLVPGVLPGVEMNAQHLHPGWFGDITATLMSYNEQAEKVPANLPFLRVTLHTERQVKVTRPNV